MATPRKRASTLAENPIRATTSLRRECLDHLLVVGDRQLHWVIKEYVEYFNRARPHQGIGQRFPGGTLPQPAWPMPVRLIILPVLNGLHHDYQRGFVSQEAPRTTSDGVFG
jgi:hypothetical protein